jgi:hypothetical protein
MNAFHFFLQKHRITECFHKRGCGVHYNFPLVIETKASTLQKSSMPLFRAIGLGIGLLVIRALMPEVFEGLENALVEFFSTIVDVLHLSKEALHNGQMATSVTYPHVPIR